MRYAQHRSRLRKNHRSAPPAWRRRVWLLVPVILLILFGVWMLRKQPKAPVQEAVEVEEATVQEDPQVFGEDIRFEEIDIFFTASGFDAGFARRNIEDGTFTHVVVADLPMIDLSVNYYEAWLVRPGVTEYFSTGEMFARDDGKFGLVWEKTIGDEEDDLFSYTRVVITRESRDGDASPAPAHVAEGEF